MSRRKIIFILGITSIVYYGIIITVFYDHNRWAREFSYIQKMMEQGQFVFSMERPSFWKKTLDFFFNDYRYRPRYQQKNRGGTPWWKPNFTTEQKKKIAKFLNKFGGFSPWDKNLDIKHLSDSINSFYAKIRERENEEFSKWLKATAGQSGKLTAEKSIFFLIAGIEAMRYKEYKRAKEILLKGIEICNDRELLANFYQNLGLIAHEQNNLDEAEFYFKKSLRLQPKNQGFNINLGWNYFLKRDFKKSLKYNKIAYEIDTTYWIPRYNIAISYLALKEYNKAFEYYKGLSEDKLEENAFFYILEDLFTLKHFEPDNMNIDFYIGYIYLNKKMFSQARVYFERFLNASSNAPKQLREIATYYLNKIKENNK